MLRKKLTLWTLSLLSLFCFNPSAKAIDVTEVIITADNAYRFAWGTDSFIPQNQWYTNQLNTSASQIFYGGAEKYFTSNPQTVTVDDYFYIIAHSDESTTQGVIADVLAKTPYSNLFSGEKGWEVYATGIDKDGNDFPTRTEVIQEIQTANTVSGGPNSSKGWVNELGQVVDKDHVVNTTLSGHNGRLAIGELNRDAATAALDGVFPYVNGISPTTKWMWYNPDPDNVTAPFNYDLPPSHQANGNGAVIAPNMSASTVGHREYLIFRLPAKALTTGDCCTECCTNFKYDFDDNHHFKVDPQTGQGLFFQTFHAKALGGLKKVSASIVSSSAISCNGTESSLGLHFQSSTAVKGWTDKLTHSPFSHEATWCLEKNTKNATFSLTQPLALTIPVSDLKCAQTVKFCIKYTFINMRCQVCEVIKCYEFRYDELIAGLPRQAQSKGQPTVAPPRPVSPPVTVPVKVKPPVRKPMELRPTIRPLTPRPAPRPPVTTRPMNERPPGKVRPVTERGPVKVRPVDQRPKTDRPSLLKPQDQVKPLDLKKDRRKPVAAQPEDGKEVPPKSDREKPAVKKPAEGKEVKAKRTTKEPANRSVLLKK